MSLAVLSAPLRAQTASPPLAAALARAAEQQVGVTTYYDPSYVRLSYPNGDVPLERGVCTDVIIRAFRGIGVDLQVEVHRDMRGHFAAYPQRWRVRGPDASIDHRRVPNLMTYFRRKGRAIALDGAYEPGDVVAWLLPSGYHHIGMVAAEHVPDTDRRYIIHNIGWGTQKEDVLYAYRIIGHYRW